MSVASSLLTSLLIVLLATVPGRGSETAPPALPANIREALEKNATAFSGLFVSGVRTRLPIAPIATVLDTLQTPETAGDFTQPLHFELRFHGSHFRESIEYPSAAASSGQAYTNATTTENSFDGTKFFIGNRRLDQPDNPGSVYIYTPTIAAAYGDQKHKSSDALSGMQFWYLSEIGFVGSTKLASLGRSVESLILQAANQGDIVSIASIGSSDDHLIEIVVESEEPWQSNETFDIETHSPYRMMTRGTGELQMRMEKDRRQLAGQHRISRFILNGEVGYAVQEKWESRKENDAILFHTKNSQFQRLQPDGPWMPMRCEIESHAYNTAPLYASASPLYQTVIQLDKCERTDYTDDQFRIWYDTPGIQIDDYTSPQATIDNPESYRIPASIESLDKRAHVRGTGAWLIAINILVILAWASYVYFRSRKNSEEK